MSTQVRNWFLLISSFARDWIRFLWFHCHFEFAYDITVVIYIITVGIPTLSVAWSYDLTRCRSLLFCFHAFSCLTLTMYAAFHTKWFPDSQKSPLGSNTTGTFCCHVEILLAQNECQCCQRLPGSLCLNRKKIRRFRSVWKWNLKERVRRYFLALLQSHLWKWIIYIYPFRWSNNFLKRIFTPDFNVPKFCEIIFSLHVQQAYIFYPQVETRFIVIGCFFQASFSATTQTGGRQKRLKSLPRTYPRQRRHRWTLANVKAQNCWRRIRCSPACFTLFDTVRCDACLPLQPFANTESW